MRIAIVTQNAIRGDGQGRANYEIARYAGRQGAKVTLVAAKVDEDLLSENISWYKLVPKVQSNALMNGIEFELRANSFLDKNKGQFDVIHGYGNTLSRPHHVNTSQFVHDAWLHSPVHTSKQHRNFYGFYQWTYSWLNAIGEKRTYNMARVVVAASNTVRSELMHIGIPESKLRVILNGHDPVEFFPGPADRAELKLPTGAPLALFTGDIKTNRKNLDSVLQAMAKMTAPMNLAVVGRLAGSPFPQMAADLGISDRVVFTDFRRDIAKIMRACDMFVFPSRYEACALVLVESLASGLPIITAKTTGGAEVVKNGSGILLDDPNDVPALTEAMTQLATDPARREVMSEAAVEAARTLTWNHIARAYYDIYTEVAAAGL